LYISLKNHQGRYKTPLELQHATAVTVLPLYILGKLTSVLVTFVATVLGET